MSTLVHRARSLAILLSFISFNLPQLCAQYLRPGIQGQIPMSHDLYEMESLLSQADAGQKADFLTRLGIDPAMAKAAVEELLPGQQIALRPVRSPEKTPYGAVFMLGFRGCFLYLLKEKDDAGKPSWRAIDQQTLDCWDGTTSLELLALRTAAWDDLVLHHVNLGHGSGDLEDQTQVYSVLGGKLVKVLETMDLLHEETIGTGSTKEQTSTFLRFPGGFYEETRATSVDEVPKTVERRYWRWSSHENKFVAGSFTRAILPHR